LTKAQKMTCNDQAGAGDTNSDEVITVQIAKKDLDQAVISKSATLPLNKQLNSKNNNQIVLNILYT